MRAPRDKIAALLSPDPDAMASSGGGPRRSLPVPRPAGEHGAEPHRRGAGRAGVPDRGRARQPVVEARPRDRAWLRIAPGSFTPDDPDWYVFIARGRARAPRRGQRAVQPAPAEYDGVSRRRPAGGRRRLGDGPAPGARRRRPACGEEIADALAASRQVHVLHLGDVYYSGAGDRGPARFLDLWPVTRIRPSGRDLVVAQRQPRHVQRRVRLLRDRSWPIPASATSDHPTASRPVSSGCARPPGTSSGSTPPGTPTSSRRARSGSCTIRRAATSPTSRPSRRASSCCSATISSCRSMTR